MKKHLAVAAMIGFFLPLFWGMLSLILFNLRDPLWTRVFWFSVYATCPGWWMPGGTDLAVVATPFLNAAAYVAAVYMFLLVKRRLAGIPG
jgi:uncharacterized membrane protein